MLTTLPVYPLANLPVYPLLFLSLRNFSLSVPATILSVLLVLTEPSILTEPIILHSLLLFLYSKFCLLKLSPFSLYWWLYLIATGFVLGFSISLSFSGAFAIALIAIATLSELWTLVTDPSVPIKVFSRHLVARILCLKLIPIFIYTFFIWLHFAVNNKHTAEARLFSPEFQATLQNFNVTESYEYVAYGSLVSLRHQNTGQYLHSHTASYPAGSQQQQITCYPVPDENSKFIIKRPLNGSLLEPNDDSYSRISHDSIIRFHHVATDKKLHSHSVRLGWNDDKEINEVSAYGSSNFSGDSNDHWKLIIVENYPSKHKELKAMHSIFRLKHVNTGCYLSSRDFKLPKWAFEQQEVICSSHARYDLTLWRFEYSEHPLDEQLKTPKTSYRKLSFFEKFIEYHRFLLKNSKRNLETKNPNASKPAEWPLLYRGMKISKNESGTPSSIYMLGNPIIWWLVVLAVISFAIFQARLLILAQRGYQTPLSGSYKQVYHGAWFLALGWALNYFPYFLIKQHLFLTNYLPSLYYGILLIGAMFDLATPTRKVTKWILAISLSAISALVFFYFSPITFGTAMSPSYCESLRWRSSWDFECPKK